MKSYILENISCCSGFKIWNIESTRGGARLHGESFSEWVHILHKLGFELFSEYVQCQDTDLDSIEWDGVRCCHPNDRVRWSEEWVNSGGQSLCSASFWKTLETKWGAWKKRSLHAWSLSEIGKRCWHVLTDVDCCCIMLHLISLKWPPPTLKWRSSRIEFFTCFLTTTRCLRPSF